MVEEARSCHLAGQALVPMGLSSNCILQIVFMTNKPLKLFISKVLESSGWGLIASRETRLWLLFNFKAFGFQYRKPEISRDLKSPSWSKYTGWHISVSTKAKGYPLWVDFPTKVGLFWITGPMEKKATHMAITSKNPKWNLSESNWENEKPQDL